MFPVIRRACQCHVANAGKPIAEDDDRFDRALRLAARVTERAGPGRVLFSNVVRELCTARTFEFTSIGGATLHGFDEPVALCELRSAWSASTTRHLR